jgi:hypothetical protein
VFQNPEKEQPFSFLLSAENGKISEIRITVDSFNKIYVPAELNEGEILRSDGNGQAVLYTKNWKRKDEIRLESELFMLSPGEHSLDVECRFPDKGQSVLKIEIRLNGEGERIIAENQ